MLPKFEVDLHRIAVVVDPGEAGEVLLRLVPVAGQHQLLEMLEVEENPRFLLKPVMITIIIVVRDRVINKRIN